MLHMAVPCCCPSELGSTMWTCRLACHAILFSLVPQQVAKCRKCTAIAAVLPALRLWACEYNTDSIPTLVRGLILDADDI